MINILVTFLIIVVFFQLFYIVNFLAIYGVKKMFRSGVNFSEKKISIVIPVFDSDKTITLCLRSILKNNLYLIKKVIVVLDHCHDDSRRRAAELLDVFKASAIELNIQNLAEGVFGKISAIKQGVKYAKTKNVLLLDADIILESDAIERLLDFHLSSKNSLCSSCLVYPYEKRDDTLGRKIIHQDRLYRNNILKSVKNKYGLANFPGTIGIINIRNYKKFFQQNFLEDLSASFNIMNEGYKISILPEVLAYEMERESFKGLFFQRVRWSIGNIQNIPLLFKTIFKTRKIVKKLIVSSYPVMWYWQHYAIVVGLLATPLFKYWQFLLTPLILYLAQITISSWSAQKKYRFTMIEILAHCIIFPFIITAALLGAFWMILSRRKFYF